MNAEDRLATLISAAVEHEVRDAEPRPDLAASVIAAYGRRRLSVRPARWRVRFSLALVCAAVVAALAAIPLLSSGSEQVVDPDDYVVASTFDPNKGVTIGYVPPGLVPSAPGPGFVKQPQQAGRVVWQIQYETASPQQGRVVPHFAIRTVTGQVSLDTWERPHGDWRPAQVPSGRALRASLGPADRQVHQVIWEARQGLLVIVDAVAIPGPEALKIAQGITVSV